MYEEQVLFGHLTGTRGFPDMVMSGIALCSICVYGCSGRSKSVFVSAISTMRPRYITPTRVEICETTARLCEMKR